MTVTINSQVSAIFKTLSNGDISVRWRPPGKHEGFYIFTPSYETVEDVLAWIKSTLR